MSLAIFLTLCIIGVDLMIYFLFQWTLGDKRRAIQRKLAAYRSAAEPSRRPILVSSRKAGPQTQARLQRVRERLQQSRPRQARAS
ncbi:MAG: hypothetical protein WBR26_05685 [Candidatus Acidiferrum sp.]